MFVSKPVTDDHLPASADGNISDLNVSSFQSAIDGLLAAARCALKVHEEHELIFPLHRSSTPSGVLPAMKAIVEAITEIGEDVKSFEARPNLDVDVSRLELLKHESTTRLNNTMQAARNHAMASGLSPVSLLDAAAGHLSANVVDIIKLLKIRRSAQGRDMRRRGSNLSIKEMVNRGDPKLANGNFDREYGTEERLRESPAVVRRPSAEPQPQPPIPKPIDRTVTPGIENRSNYYHPAQPGSGPSPPTFRINSFQSASSGHRSDSFDLERKASVTSDRHAPVRPVIETRNVSDNRVGKGNGNGNGNGSNHGNGIGYSRSSLASVTSGSSAVAPISGRDAPPYSSKSIEIHEEPEFPDEGGDEQEWEDLKVSSNAHPFISFEFLCVHADRDDSLAILEHPIVSTCELDPKPARCYPNRRSGSSIKRTPIRSHRHCFLHRRRIHKLPPIRPTTRRQRFVEGSGEQYKQVE